MKRLCLVLIALVLVCGSLFAGGQTDQPTSTEKKVTLGVFGDLQSAYDAVFQTEDFQAKYPNVKVEMQSSDFGGHHDRLVTQIAAGTGANDVEALEIGYIARFVADGGLTDLSKAPYNGRDVGKDLVKFGMGNSTTTDGKLVAMPVDIAPAIMFWRKSICDKAGVKMDDIPNWDEYVKIGKILTVDLDGDGTTDQFAITHPGDMAMLPLNGGKGDWFNKAGDPLEPKAKFMEVLNLVKNVRAAKIDGNFGAWSGEWINAFKESKVVTMFSGAWLGGHFKNWMCPDLAGDWRVSYPPGKIFASNGGSYLSIPEQVAADKKPMAYEILKYLCTSESAQKVTFKTTDAFPALTTLFKDKVMSEPVEYFGGQKVRLIYADVAQNIPVQNVTPFDVIAADIFSNAITSVINDGVPPEDAYSGAKTEILNQIK
ncbi:MAG: extracellular solute-binding protein [Spirochaetales bacterium]|nr:extracellular solute-binding protein [Spirochaetales bacterium]